MTELVDRASILVQRHGGAVRQFTGDGIMAVFGAPITLEDHAFRACLASIGIQQRLSTWLVRFVLRWCRTLPTRRFELGAGRRRGHRLGTWGVVQYHFGDRDGLLMAVVDKGFGELLQSLRELTFSAENTRDRTESRGSAEW